MRTGVVPCGQRYDTYTLYAPHTGIELVLDEEVKWAECGGRRTMARDEAFLSDGREPREARWTPSNQRPRMVSQFFGVFAFCTCVRTSRCSSRHQASLTHLAMNHRRKLVGLRPNTSSCLVYVCCVSARGSSPRRGGGICGRIVLTSLNPAYRVTSTGVDRA